MQDFCKILKGSKTIAIVGLSSNPFKTSRIIADYLVNNGFLVVGVNPTTTLAGDLKVYSSLEEIDFPIDIVNVFRNSEDIPQIIQGVLKLKPKVLWLQLGIRNDEAVKPVIAAGIEVIQNNCIQVTHSYCK